MSPALIIQAVSQTLAGVTNVIASSIQRRALTNGSATQLPDRITYEHVDRSNTYIIVGLLIFLILASTAIIVVKKS